MKFAADMYSFASLSLLNVVLFFRRKIFHRLCFFTPLPPHSDAERFRLIPPCEIYKYCRVGDAYVLSCWRGLVVLDVDRMLSGAYREIQYM